MASSSSRKINSICVLGGSRIGNGNKYEPVVSKLGSLLAQKNIKLVYGGGKGGLIGKVASMAASEGAKVLSIVLSTIKNFVNTTTFGVELEVPSLLFRIPKMLDHSDAFIALPGGIIAMGDILHIGSWISMAIHAKPIGILNINGFYDGLLTLLDHAVQEGFMDETIRKIFISDSDPEQLIEKLETFELQDVSAGSQFDWFGIHSKKRKRDDLDLRLSI